MTNQDQLNQDQLNQDQLMLELGDALMAEWARNDELARLYIAQMRAMIRAFEEGTK